MNQKHALWTGLCLLLVSAEAVAQDAASSDQPQTAEAKAPAAEKKAPLAAVVRGLYVDTHVGGGFMLVNADVEPDAFNPGVSGSEELGSGTVFGVSVGYDITDAVALQLLTGAVMVSGGRSDKVRDLSLLYGGLGGRFGVPLSER